METRGEKSSEGYSPTPERGTPDFANMFMPDQVAKTLLDGNGCSNEKSTDTPESVAYMPVAKDSHLYNMNHKHRGKCIVFNHEELSYQSSKYRHCSSVYASRIKQTFHKLGFDVEIHEDLTYEKIMEKIRELSEGNHEDSDCICIFMLKHEWDKMRCPEDIIHGDNEIWKPFTADNCKTLAGKPKPFFFQTCGGDKFVAQSDDSLVLGYLHGAWSLDTETNDFSYTIPIYADFLISHSTVRGFCSWPDKIQRACFVHRLCDVLDQYADTTDLLKMLTITARKAAKTNVYYRCNYNEDWLKICDKRVPSTMSMLLRDVYFTPKQEYSGKRPNTQ